MQDVRQQGVVVVLRRRLHPVANARRDGVPRACASSVAGERVTALSTLKVDAVRVHVITVLAKGRTIRSTGVSACGSTIVRPQPLGIGYPIVAPWASK
jgi:hypothetical protein